jgi:predicted AlkP superfamily phosphohydrolase/phosphomutase
MYCNNWLKQQGWLSAKSEGTGVANPDRWIRRLGLSRDKVGRLILRIPGLARSRLVKQAAKSRSAVADVERSKAYCVPMYNNVMGIRINLAGEARESLRREIMQGLKEIVDPETGQTPVREIYRGEDYYFGPHAGHFPDVIVILEPDYEGTPLLGHYSSVVTRMSAPPFGGSHRMEGIFMASGPAVIANPEPLAGLNIEDVAPTILYLMGLPVPSDMDGRPLAEIVSPTVLESRPIRHGEPIGFWPREDEVTFTEEVISEQDEAEIRERLQALGYLE